MPNAMTTIHRLVERVAGARGRRVEPRTVAVVSRVVASGIVVALVATGLALWPRQESTHVTGMFARAVGLYPGSDVRVLGVPIGTVTSVTPVGDRVAVAFEYDAAVRVPANARAAVVAPSLVSDRYVQLLPAYTSGPVLSSGSSIPLDRTAVPVELDRISQSLDDLMVALGPEGANRNGALSRLLDTGARNLQGQGIAIHDTNHDLSLTLQTLAGGRSDLFSTVKNLQSFTSTLAVNDSQVRRLNGDLASVSDQLAGERADLAAALKNLAIALTETASFVHDNRAVLKTDIAQLASVTGTIARQRNALAESLTNAPVAVSNLQNAYNPTSGTLDTRNNAAQLNDPALLLCALINGPTGTGNTSLCKSLQQTLKVPAAPAGASLPGSPSSGMRTEVAGGVQVRGPDPTLGGLLGGPR